MKKTIVAIGFCLSCLLLTLSAHAETAKSSNLCQDLLMDLHSSGSLRIQGQNFSNKCNGALTVIAARDNSSCIRLNSCATSTPTPAPQPSPKYYGSGTSGDYYDGGAYYHYPQWSGGYSGDSSPGTSCCDSGSGDGGGNAQ